MLDSSATLAWVLEEEQQDSVAATIMTVVTTGAVVPSIWRLEVGNTLQMAVRRGRMTLAQRDKNLADLLRWPIEIDDETDRHAWSSTLRLADRHKLTLYDAAYLELAERRRLPLATLDGDLIKAAAAIGVPLCV